MFTITAATLNPIRRIALVLDPAANLNEIGAWGILFAGCGGLAGKGLEWQSAVIENLNAPTPEQYVRFAANGVLPDEYYAQKFAELLKEWATDKVLHTMIERRMGDAGRSNPKARTVVVKYTVLAMHLNSLKSGDGPSDELNEIAAFASASETGWPEMFFAAGLLLTIDPAFSAHDYCQAIIHISPGHTAELKALFKQVQS